jgi:hypothetical protein
MPGKITELDETSNPVSTDLIEIVQDVATTPVNKKVTISSLFGSIPVSLISDTDSTDDLGSSSKYWANGYVDKIYLNATASLDGATPSIIHMSGLMACDKQLLNADNTSLNNGGSGYCYNAASTFNKAHSGMYVRMANLYAGTRTKNLTGFELKVIHDVGQTASALFGSRGLIQMNANNSIMTLGSGYTNVLSLANKSGMGITTYSGYMVEAISSILADANTMTIGTYAGLNVNTQAAVTNLTVTNMYGVLIGDITGGATNYAIYTGRGDVRLMSNTADKLGFWGATPIAQAVLATGVSHTVDDVITALQNLGLVKQS